MKYDNKKKKYDASLVRHNDFINISVTYNTKNWLPYSNFIVGGFYNAGSFFFKENNTYTYTHTGIW